MEFLNEKCTNVINQILKKYETNSYALQRLEFHVNNLDHTISVESDNHSKRLLRANNLAIEQEMFIDVFLSQNNYFFLPNGDGCYYIYDGKTYKVVKEDDILHKILTTISYDSGLQEWKYKTKNAIIKQIKNTSLFSSMPETATIQSVLKRLCPGVFSNRETAKYFLTILGDNILKKNKEQIYLTSNKTKTFLSQLDEYVYITTGQLNITRNFIKYHETHEYANCRLCDINDDSEDIVTIDQTLNLICVACHYSNRFQNADEFLLKKGSHVIKEHALYLKTNSLDTIIESFCSRMIDPTETISSTQTTFVLKWKDMHYLWKTYLSSLSIPNIVYSNKLKQILIQKYTYSELNDCFIEITSKHLPHVQKFLHFWGEYIETEKEDELEIDELCNLAKQTGNTIGETETLKIICHFFPEVPMEDNKYLSGISCKLWDKASDIEKSLDAMKKEFKEKNDNSFISFSYAYNFYCQMFTSGLIVSKNYFENYLRKHLSLHIHYDTFIHSDWYSHGE